MSYDIFLQAPDPSQTDEEVAMASAGVTEVLGPYLRSVDGSYAEITTADGTADVYGIAEPGSGVMINHAAGSAIWDLIVEVARATEFVIILGEQGTAIPYEGMRDSLPEYLPRPISIVSSGAELLSLVTGS